MVSRVIAAIASERGRQLLSGKGRGLGADREASCPCEECQMVGEEERSGDALEDIEQRHRDQTVEQGAEQGRAATGAPMRAMAASTARAALITIASLVPSAETTALSRSARSSSDAFFHSGGTDVRRCRVRAGASV